MFGEGGDHSILNVMKRFNEAVKKMDDTVMIPTRLKDVKMETTTAVEREMTKLGEVSSELNYSFIHLSSH